MKLWDGIIYFMILYIIPRTCPKCILYVYVDCRLTVGNNRVFYVHWILVAQGAIPAPALESKMLKKSLIKKLGRDKKNNARHSGRLGLDWLMAHLDVQCRSRCEPRGKYTLAASLHIVL
jgi:hypothetical protein